MIEFKGTKGKWIAEKSEVVRHASSGSISPYWKQICSFVPSGVEAKANAKLISQAPAMLNMLDKLLPVFQELKIVPLANEIEQLLKEATEI